MSTLAEVIAVEVPEEIILSTVESLRDFGENGDEGFLLWTGMIVGQTATVQRLLVPPQESISSENGVGYFVTGETLYHVNRFLAETRLRLIAQVHSHPGRAYHSVADDKYAVVTTEGGFSLVVPDFARGAVVLDRWAVHRLWNRSWRRLSGRETSSLFRLVRT